MPRKSLLLIAATTIVLALPAAALALPLGGLTQFPGSSGCVTYNGGTDCGTFLGLNGAYGVATSPDGKNVYETSAYSALITYSRDSTGVLTQTGCFNFDGSSGCTALPVLGTNYDVTVSPDGKTVYVIEDAKRSIIWFNRNTATGALSYASCLGPAAGTSGCPALTGPAFGEPQSAAVSADGKSVYVVSTFPSELATFTRASDGSLGSTASCFRPAAAGSCSGASGLSHAVDVVVSPDDANVYAVSDSASAVASFARAAGGALTQLGGSGACIGVAGPPCAAGHAMNTARQLAISPDGNNLYVTSETDDALVVLDRGAGGALSQAASPAGCIGPGPPNCATAVALTDADSVAASPDGKSVYVGTGYNTPGTNTLVTLQRASNGTLSQPASPDGCLSETGTPCAVGRKLDDVQSLAIPPDGLNLYAGVYTDGALLSFARELPPTCTDSSLQTLSNIEVTDVPLSCNDPNGDPTTLAISTAPAHGTASINQGTRRARFTPTSRYHGPDNFTFTASDGSLTSEPATAQISLTDKLGPLIEFGNQRFLRLNKTGSTKVTLTCPKSEVDGCPNGKLAITSSRRINITLKKRRKAKLALGSAKFALAAGESKSVRVKLSKRARTVVRHLRNVRVNLTATSKDPGANTGTATKATRIKAPTAR